MWPGPVDGETGEKFHQKATVGIIYMSSSFIMVDDKMHARSIGPTVLLLSSRSVVKSQFGGQRFGRWGLGTGSYGASNILQELLH